MKQKELFSPVVVENALPEPKGAKKRKQKQFKPPDLKPGEIGGFVVDRTDVQNVQTWDWSIKNVPFHVKHFWSPRLGRVKDWFEIELHGPGGTSVISMPQDFLYKMRLGDWVTVHKFVQDSKHAVAKKATVIPVPYVPYRMELNIAWFGPATVCAGEGKIGRGIDDQDRRLVFTWRAYRDHFGARIRKRRRSITVELYQAIKKALGGSYYSILGLNPPPPPVSDEQIKKAFRDNSKKVHPDLNPDDPGAATKFHDLKEAYEAIKDQASRIAYEMIMDLTQQTFAANKGKGIDAAVLLQGNHPEGWFPPISSGKATVLGSLVGNTILISKIKQIDLITDGNKTRICTMVDGIPTLLWGHNV
jgi:hypothetical protein